MTLTKTAFALKGWAQYWGDRFAAAKTLADLESAASECDATAPDWVTQEYLFKARDSYILRRQRFESALKG